MTGSTVDPIIWSNVEISVGIICACLPILRPVFQAAKHRLFGESTAATLHSSQFSPTSDEIAGFKQSPKMQSPTLVRKAEGYLVMPETELPDLPAAADFERGGQRAGFGSPEKERWGLDLGEDDVAKEQVRAQERDVADAV